MSLLSFPKKPQAVLAMLERECFQLNVPAKTSFYDIAKRILDVAIAAILLILLSPLLLLTSVLVKLTSPGPVIFHQVRAGLRGEPFIMYKFRTMRDGAEEDLALVKDLNEKNGPIFKIVNDPRLTRLGRFLRRSSMDELPQLFNVLRGEMSLVGPRPIVRDEVGRYGKSIEFYYAAKPGLTGLWQVSGRTDTSYERRIGLDVWYVRNWTPWHDIAILLRTIPVVFLQRGAH